MSGVIDAHVHVFPPEIIEAREDYLGRDLRFAQLYASPKATMVAADEVVEHMDGCGVERSVIMGFAFRDPGLCRLVNDYVLEAVGRYPDRLTGLACASPGDAGASAEVERCLEAGLRGCGELALDVDDLDTSSLDAIAGRLVERGLPLLVHASEPVGHEYPGKGRFLPGSCLALAKAYPALTIVFAHMGGGLFLYETMPEVRAALEKVYYDTAALPYVYDADIYHAAMSSAGCEKLIFGSDYPLLSPRRYEEGLGRLTLAQRMAVQSANARKVYRL